jgi:hypothetical protein
MTERKLETPAEAHERGYITGTRAARQYTIRALLRELDPECDDAPEVKLARLVVEREEALQHLRDLCAEFGDNDWPNDLHLADVIDKHLGRYLWELAEKIPAQEVKP